MMKALIYTRVSEDRAGGRSPREQEAEARQHCQREGWDVIEVVTDSVGASRHSKGKRQGWDRVLESLAGSKRPDVLVTWEASRAQRDLAAYAKLRDLCVQHGILWAYSGRLHDLSSSRGRFDTGLDALLAEREADETSERCRRATRANAAAGRPHGRRLFGYQRVYDATTGALVGQEPEPNESATVRSIFRDYLGGHGVRTVARALNDAGATTGTGARWNDAQVRRVLTNPAYAARRVHQGQIVGPADWPALVDDETFESVQARLAARAGTRTTKQSRLLTGVARCGECGSKMGALYDRRGRRFYECRESYCVARDLQKLDAFVTTVLLERLARLDLDVAPTDDTASDRAELAQVQTRLDEAIGAFTEGTITAATLAKIETDLGRKITILEKRIRSAALPIAIDLPAPDAIDAWWDDLEPEVRREVVAAFVSAVVVKKARKGGHRFDPDAVEVEWRR